MSESTTVHVPPAAVNSSGAWPPPPAMPTDLPAGVRCTFEFILPDRATDLLARNINPRKMRQTRVDQYAREMKAGRWAPYTSAIMLDANGNLVDGQHRCAGSVEAGVGFWTLIIYGVDEPTVEALDQGLKRTVGDVLRGHGELNHLGLASTISMMWRWDRNEIFFSRTPTIAETREWLDANPGIRAAVSHASSYTAPPLRMRITVIGALIYRTTIVDPEAAEDFRHKLLHGVNLGEDDAILRYRKWLMEKRISAYGRPSREMELALGVKTWNAHIQGKPLKALRWARGGVHKVEDMPMLVDATGTPYPFPDVVIRQAKAAADADANE
jgi:hypothetical protein